MITSPIHQNSPLWSFIAHRATHNRSENEEVAPPPFPGADYWLLASLLQKAIRRGDFFTARRAAHQLRNSDAHRLWRRLMVIALEDVGIGDPETVVQAVVLAAKPRWREEFGGDLAVLDRLLADMCAASKDRSGDHICSLILDGHPEPFPKAPKTASRAILLTTVSSPALPMLTRLDAAVRAADLISSPKRLPTAKLAGLEALFGLFREMGCPPLIVEACKEYTGKSSDILPLVLPLVWLVWKETGAQRTMRTHKIASDDLGGGLPSYAFDPLHTRPGKQAVEMWLRPHRRRLPWSTRQISAALWNYESAACNQTLDWFEGNRLQDAAYRTDLLRAGVPVEQCADIAAWVREAYPSLTNARRAIWERSLTDNSPVNSGLEQANPQLPVPDEDSSRD